jgi:hypothetical protein
MYSARESLASEFAAVAEETLAEALVRLGAYADQLRAATATGLDPIAVHVVEDCVAFLCALSPVKTSEGGTHQQQLVERVALPPGGGSEEPGVTLPVVPKVPAWAKCTCCGGSGRRRIG